MDHRREDRTPPVAKVKGVGTQRQQHHRVPEIICKCICIIIKRIIITNEKIERHLYSYNILTVCFNFLHCVADVLVSLNVPLNHKLYISNTIGD